MRWLVFLIIIVFLLTAQSALAHRVALMEARPDWLLVVVIFVALHARRHDAILGAWLVGMCADLMTLERCGLIAMSYVLVAVAVISVRDFLFRDRGLTQFFVTLAACLAVQLVWLVYRRTMYDLTSSLPSDLAIGVVVKSVYTALWAPLLHAVLLRMRKTLGITAPRFGYAGRT